MAGVIIAVWGGVAVMLLLIGIWQRVQEARKREKERRDSEEAGREKRRWEEKKPRTKSVSERIEGILRERDRIMQAVGQEATIDQDNARLWAERKIEELLNEQ